MAYSTHIRFTAYATHTRSADYDDRDLPEVFGQLFELSERRMVLVQQRPVLTVARTTITRTGRSGRLTLGRDGGTRSMLCREL